MRVAHVSKSIRVYTLLITIARMRTAVLKYSSMHVQRCSSFKNMYVCFLERCPNFLFLFPSFCESGILAEYILLTKFHLIFYVTVYPNVSGLVFNQQTNCALARQLGQGLVKSCDMSPGSRRMRKVDVCISNSAFYQKKSKRE